MALLIASGIPTFRLQTPGVPPKLQAVFRNASATTRHPAVIRHALSTPNISVHLEDGEDHLLVGASVRGSTTLSNGQLVRPEEIDGLSIPTVGSIQPSVAAAATQPWQGPPPYQGKPSRPMCIDCGADFPNAGLLGKHKKRSHHAVEPEPEAVTA